MKANLLSTVGLWAIVILLFLNLLATLFEPKTVSAQKDTNSIGRYQITSWAAYTGGSTHHAGYYVLDTVTGKIFDKYYELHNQDK